ncbi:hypothetical protein [Cryobacterium ruanii]|uniref:hypothetical protein n=1 Tax=Cryobacterium ruanii TaxID=1259197 RepID=UPI003BB1A43B
MARRGRGVHPPRPAHPRRRGLLRRAHGGAINSAALQVVTTSIPVALVASRNAELSVYNLGGTVDPDDDSQSGQWTRESLEHIRIDTAFISVSGLTSDGQLLATNPKAARVKRAAMDAATTVVLIANHDQLDAHGLVKFAQLDELDHLVVDAGVSHAVLTLAAEAGVPVLCAVPLETEVAP